MKPFDLSHLLSYLNEHETTKWKKKESKYYLIPYDEFAGSTLWTLDEEIPGSIPNTNLGQRTFLN